MSFFPVVRSPELKLGKGKIDIQLVHQLQCKACPLAQIHNKNPHMEPTGSDRPVIYMLGAGPDGDEDHTGRHFTGRSGELLRARIPKQFKKKIRWNHVVRTRPHDSGFNRAPTPFEIECCRPSVVKDIEQTKPKAIFGFGDIPLQWATGNSGIVAYRGRRLPIKVGSHTCWYYPMTEPSFLMKQGRRAYYSDLDPTAIGSELERAFEFDLAKALEEIFYNYKEPEVHTPEYALSNTLLITEASDRNLERIYTKLHQLSAASVIGLDYETHGDKDRDVYRPYDKAAKILSVAVGTGNDGIAFGFDHPGAGWSRRQRKELDDIWVDFLRTCKAVKVAHNLLYEMEWTGYFYGIDLLRTGRWEDTATQANTLDERSRGSKPGPLSLEFQILQNFGLNIKKLANVDAGNLINTPLPIVLQYNGLDARYGCLLYKKLRKELKKEKLTTTYKYRLRCVSAIAMAQIKGIPVDQLEVKRLHDKYTDRLEDLTGKINAHEHVLQFAKKYGRPFKPLAPKDVVDLFGHMLGYTQLNVEVKAKDRIKAQESGGSDREERLSGNERVLNELPGDLPKHILGVRKATKRKSTYIESIMHGAEGTDLYPDKLLHPSFNLLFASTGRLSADGPPVQQFPKRDGEAKEVRRPVVAEKNCVMISVDYGQIEARVIAMYTKDKRFCKALWERYDIHQEWAERIAHAYPARIGGKKMLTDKKAMKDFRTDIKNQWTFPLVFGATLKSVAEYLRIPENIIKVQYDTFWDQFSGIHDWQKQLKKFYQENGYVETFLGRRRHAPLSDNKIYNSPVQGVTAELVMDAFCRLSETNDPVLQAELQIHDDITFFRVPDKKAEHYLEQIISIMLSTPFEWAKIVPIAVEASLGYDWLGMHEVGIYSSDEWDSSIIRRAQKCIEG